MSYFGLQAASHEDFLTRIGRDTVERRVRDQQHTELKQELNKPPPTIHAAVAVDVDEFLKRQLASHEGAQSRLAAAVAEAELKADKTVRPRPMILPRSAELAGERKVDELIKWRADREERLEAKRAAIRAAAPLPSPSINKNSDKLAARWAADRHERSARREAAALADATKENTFAPRINGSDATARSADCGLRAGSRGQKRPGSPVRKPRPARSVNANSQRRRSFMAPTPPRPRRPWQQSQQSPLKQSQPQEHRQDGQPATPMREMAGGVPMGILRPPTPLVGSTRRISFGTTRQVFVYHEPAQEKLEKQHAAAPAFDAADQVRLANEQFAAAALRARETEGFGLGTSSGNPGNPGMSEHLAEYRGDYQEECAEEARAEEEADAAGLPGPAELARMVSENNRLEQEMAEMLQLERQLEEKIGVPTGHEAHELARAYSEFSAAGVDDEEHADGEIPPSPGGVVARAEMLAALGLEEADLASRSPPPRSSLKGRVAAKPAARPRVVARSL